LAVGNQDRAASLYERGVGSTFAILFPLILVMTLFAPEGLRFWLGADFARRSAAILQILAIGVFVNSLANIPYALLQASGRPDLTAKLHVAEIPFYLAMLYWAIRMRGNEGAAIAWTCRLCAEAAVLFFLSRSILKSSLAPRLMIAIASGTVALLVACIIVEPLLKVLFLIAALAAFGCATWSWILNDFRRLRLRSSIKAAPLFG
jgi:O-antigen/teichoic acid export membrane protein